MEKHSVSRLSYLFAHLHLLSSDSFSSDLLSSNLSLLSASSLLCFSSLHIVGSLTSKLPSIIQYSIVEPSGTLAMYDIVCHSHSPLFLQHQYYNTTQIQLHQIVKGRRCLCAQQRGYVSYVCCILSLSFDCKTTAIDKT